MATRSQSLSDYISSVDKSRVIAKTTVFSDLDATFKKNPFTGDIYVKKDIEAVKNSVRNIVLTGNFERPFQPEFGGNIKSMLFENLDEDTVDTMQYVLTQSIELYEPRVYVNNIIFNENALDRNSIEITVSFTMKSTGQQADLVTILERIR